MGVEWKGWYGDMYLLYIRSIYTNYTVVMYIRICVV